tara:strand:+ start:10117 stop:10233 length:117 start_codon:yes stop_codon:yes gene_type:complete
MVIGGQPKASTGPWAITIIPLSKFIFLTVQLAIESDAL